jgi:transposase-like protein
MSILSEPHFHNERAAIDRLEAIVWPSGPTCPHCGGLDRITAVKGGRAGLRRCGDCKKQFTCKVGTVFESSHVPLHKWFQAAHLLASRKKGISSHQLHRTLKVTYKTAWFMSHRLREAMRPDDVAPMGGTGAIVEADETFYGQVEGEPKRRGTGHKHVILTLVQRRGSARSFHVEGTRIADIAPVIGANLKRESTMMTDEGTYYREVGREFARHDTVNHKQDEYVRGDAHTNTAEGFFSIFKRGMMGVYQHCKEKHLHRYLAEFDFRYSNRVRLGVDDAERTKRALKGIVGKRLTYRRTGSTDAISPTPSSPGVSR